MSGGRVPGLHTRFFTEHLELSSPALRAGRAVLSAVLRRGQTLDASLCERRSPGQCPWG